MCGVRREAQHEAAVTEHAILMCDRGLARTHARAHADAGARAGAHAPRMPTTHAQHAYARIQLAPREFVRAPPAQTTARPASYAGRTGRCPPSRSPTACTREGSSGTSPGCCLHTRSAAPAKSVWVRGFARAAGTMALGTGVALGTGHAGGESVVATSRTDGLADPTAKSRPMRTRLSR